MSTPVVGGVELLSVEPVDPEPDDDMPVGYAIAGRALVTFRQTGAIANGLLIVNAMGDRRCIIWERPLQGGRGRFRVVPIGRW